MFQTTAILNCVCEGKHHSQTPRHNPTKSNSAKSLVTFTTYLLINQTQYYSSKCWNHAKMLSFFLNLVRTSFSGFVTPWKYVMFKSLKRATHLVKRRDEMCALQSMHSPYTHFTTYSKTLLLLEQDEEVASKDDWWLVYRQSLRYSASKPGQGYSWI